MKKTLIFDLDGTLLNTLGDLHQSVNYALKKCGFIEQNIEKTREYVGNGLKMLIKRSLPAVVPDKAVDIVLCEMKQHYVLHCCEKTKPYAGIPELLTKAKINGYKMAVVSNKADSILREIVPYYFGNLISVVIGESPSMCRKPAPDMVFEALHRLDSSAEEALYIGDSEVDIETAKNAGLPCLSVSWGFRSRSLLIESGASQICDTPCELFDHICKL